MMTTVADDLKTARDLISSPDHWAADFLAQNSAGTPVSPLSDRACTWCALGAIGRAVGVGDYDRIIITPESDVLGRAAKELFGKLPEHVNDYHGHAAVLRMYDRAIELASEDSQP